MTSGIASPRDREWVIVCGGFHRTGGMDRANAALARHLLDAGAVVHLVSHAVEPALAAHANARTTIVARPAGSHLAGELALERAAGQVVGRLRQAGQGPHVVANGANFAGATVNWVHSVHRAWACRDDGAPALFRLRNRAFKAWARRRERRALAAAPMVIANSRRTAGDLAGLGVPPARVRTVYLGSDPAWRPASGERRREVRSRWCTDPGRPLVAFVGALGHDTNKGIDVLLDALQLLLAGGWGGEVVVAGPGAAARWISRAASLALPVRFVGLTDKVDEILDAADLLVSPVSYEAYGLAAHEAVCREVPVIITRTAGLAERLAPELSDMLLPDRPDAAALADALRRWTADPRGWRQRVAPTAARLREYGERDMASAIVNLALSEAA